MWLMDCSHRRTMACMEAVHIWNGEAEIIRRNGYISTFFSLPCFYFTLPVYVSFLWASHLFEERLGSERAKGSPVFSADAPRMSHNPVLGGMKDKCCFGDCGWHLPLIRAVIPVSLVRCNSVPIQKENRRRGCQWAEKRSYLCCAEDRNCWSIFIVRVAQVHATSPTNPNPRAQKQDLWLRLPCNFFGGAAVVKLIQQDLSWTNHAAFSGNDWVWQLKGFQFLCCYQHKKSFCFVSSLKSSRTRTALEVVIQGSCSTHKSSRWLVAAEHHGATAEC